MFGQRIKLVLFILVFFFILIFLYTCKDNDNDNVNGDPVGITFIKTYPEFDTGYCVQQTSDSGYIIAGRGMNRFFLLKADTLGNISWSLTDYPDIKYCTYTLQTSDGGFVVTGVCEESYNSNAFIIKTDSSGNVLWYNSYGDTGFDEGKCIQLTLDSGFIIAGITDSYGAGDYDVYLVKIDSAGNEQWHNTFGGISVDLGFYVQQTSDGGYIITGQTSSFGAGSNDIYLVKTDASGNEHWHRTFGGANEERSYSVEITSDGGYIVAGLTGSYGAGNWDVYLVKTDSEGVMEWYMTYGGIHFDYASRVKQTVDGGYILSGYTESFGSGLCDVYLIKTDPVGNELWYKTFGRGAFDTAYDVEQTSDNGFIISGFSNSYDYGDSLFLIKTDYSGNSLPHEED